MSNARSNRWALGLAVAIAALGAGCAHTAAAHSPTWEGELVPELALPDLDGRRVSLASMRGSWVVLHFTATWCPFCDSEIAHLNALAETFAARGVKTVIVDVEEDAAKWQAYARKNVHPTVTALHDATGRATARFAPAGAQPSFADRAEVLLDATLIIDPSGIITRFALVDSGNFDPTFREVRAELDRRVPAAAPVVVRALPVTGTAGDHTELTVRLVIASGHHVMSDHPSEPNYVATRVVMDPAVGFAFAEARYPAPRDFALGDKSISTFAGDTEVRIPVAIAADMPPGPRRVTGSVRYQACTHSRCFFPVTAPIEALVTVSPSSEKGDKS